MPLGKVYEVYDTDGSQVLRCSEMSGQDIVDSMLSKRALSLRTRTTFLVHHAVPLL